MNRLKTKSEKRKIKTQNSKALSFTLYFLAFSFYFFVSACPRQHVSTSAQLQQTPARGDNYKIGVILPLTGRYSLYGESTLHGIECAIGIFSPCESPIKAELFVKNDAGEPERAVAAVEELVNVDKVSVIIGPLSSSSIDAAAGKAQSLGVPLISLSQNEGVTALGDDIFRVSLTAESQVDAIVNWALRKKMKRFAIAYPMNTYGETYKKLFTEKVKMANGQIVLSEGYGEANMDFGGMFEKEVNFDALFIPDSYRAVGYIVSIAPKVQLLGISRWNNSELIDRGGEAVEGAVFVDGFFDKSDSSIVQKFVGTFKQAYNLDPTILEANGFDASRLAIRALQTTGGKHAPDVRSALAAQPEIEGATGNVSFDSNRGAIRRMFLLTVKNGKIVESDGQVKPVQQMGKY